MPVNEFTASETSSNLRRNRHSRWPDGRRTGEDRLKGFAAVMPMPTFGFDRSDRILTIGSCFAREIEGVLHKLDFVLPALDVSIPREERNSETANDILNKYTVQSMENEIRWGFEATGIAPEEFFLRADADTWVDPQMVPNLVPVSLERVIERRQMVSQMMARLPECRIVVITLGLVEAWFDTRTGLYLNGMPPTYATRTEPDRFVLRVLSYDEILESLERIHVLIGRYGHPEFRMLITVSPVPFKATLTGNDALVANTYGKSVQRAAAEIFASRHENVNYFPSYEIVTLTDRSLAYNADNIHVTRPMVEHIMGTVLRHYAPDCAAELAQPAAEAEPAAAPVPQKAARVTPSSLMLLAKHSMVEKDYEAAITALSSLLFRFESQLSRDNLVSARLTLGVALLRARHTDEGVKQLEICKQLAPDDPRTTYKLALGLDRLRMRDEALAMFTHAVRLAPQEPDYHWRLGEQYLKFGERARAEEHLAEALRLDPDHAKSRAALSNLGAAA